MRCFRKLLGISYRDHITNDAVRDRIRQATGPYDDILTTGKKRKLKWFGHVSRSSGLATTIFQGTVQGGRRTGRQNKRWDNNICDSMGLKFCNAVYVREDQNKIKWRERVAMYVAFQRSLTTGQVQSQSFASNIFFHQQTGETTSKFSPFAWEKWMILTRGS